MRDPTIALVTGAGRGIGLEISRQFAARDVQVILTARDPVAGAHAAHALGNDVVFFVLDVADDSSVRSLAKRVEERFNRLDVLVNNAGIIAEEDENVLTISPSAIRQTLETNTLGPLRVAQALAPLLRKSSNGRIVNVSSGMGALHGIGSDHAAYRISKTALNAVTGMLAAELSGDRISVNSMCPGWVRTAMGGAGAERDVYQGAEGVVWLALDAPQSLSGHFIRDHAVIPW